MDGSQKNWAIMVTWHQHFIIMYDLENIKKINLSESERQEIKRTSQELLLNLF